MIFYKLRRILNPKSIAPNRLVLVATLVLIVLAWPLPLFFENLQFKFFDIPFIYFYIILVGPALILFVTNWIVKLADRVDRNQLETEND